MSFHHQIWRTGLVRRFHTVASAPEQNNAAHQWGVAIILLQYHPSPSFNLIASAITHDVAEYWTGDVRADAKWGHPELAALIGDIEERKLDELDLLYDLTEEDVWWLKCADMLELSFYTRHRLNMGDRYFAIIFMRCLEWFKKHEADVPEPIWKAFWEEADNVPTTEDLA